MRSTLIPRYLTVMLAAAALVSFAGSAQATRVEVSLTHQQVANVCGKDLATGGGYSGCDKKCGDQICDYHCNPKGKCGSFVVRTLGKPQNPVGSGTGATMHQ